MKATLTRGQPCSTDTSRTDRRGGLTYLNNRYLDPVLGSFVSVDPLVTSTHEPHLRIRESDYLLGSSRVNNLVDPLVAPLGALDLVFTGWNWWVKLS